MPKLKTALAKGVEPEEGGKYKISEVEEVKTAVQGFSGVRVKLDPLKAIMSPSATAYSRGKRKEGDDREFATMLWMRETAGTASKLGSFLAAFGDFLGDEDLAVDTDNWLGHTIRIVSWKPRAREIEVVE